MSSSIFGILYFITEDSTISGLQSSFSTSFTKTSCSQFLSFTLLFIVFTQEAQFSKTFTSHFITWFSQRFLSLLKQYLNLTSTTNQLKSKMQESIFLTSIMSAKRTSYFPTGNSSCGSKVQSFIHLYACTSAILHSQLGQQNGEDRTATCGLSQ